MLCHSPLLLLGFVVQKHLNLTHFKHLSVSSDTQMNDNSTYKYQVSLLTLIRYIISVNLCSLPGLPSTLYQGVENVPKDVKVFWLEQ